MAWFYLIIAGLFEMTGVTMINKLHTEKSKTAFVLMTAGFGLSFLFLSLAMETLSMGTAYAVWTGIGAAGGALAGIVWYGEPKSLLRLSCIALIVSAVIGLKLIS
ncbi:DMT family transporter [Alteribacillus bidgolensis]|uniref:Paired small multidrug resistance pump n=1 Tax=Alteribacillus bidgolensis TaxID=930129 RepID=A0A1G8IKR6_9BACI|nr:multidrug efflux SMR transporter [Alteribacillus bidgolensis]SDI19432.1 paired small multidrug resistance pump [Alteribacillus bidgolensis]